MFSDFALWIEPIMSLILAASRSRAFRCLVHVRLQPLSGRLRLRPERFSRHNPVLVVVILGLDESEWGLVGLVLIPKCLLSSLTTKRAEPASGNGPQNFEPLGVPNIILGFRGRLER